MAVTWSITRLSDGTTKSFAEWNIDAGSVNRTLRNQQADTFRFRQLIDFTTDEDFAIDTTLIVRKGNIPFFHGRVVNLVRTGEPDSESIDYELAGPWWYLDNLTMQQNWAVPSDRDSADSPLEKFRKSRLILGQGEDGVKIDTGAVVREAINYAISNGALLRLGLMYTGPQIPVTEAVDQTCAEVIRQMIRWTPDVVCQFDYSTTPPTLNVARPSGFAALTKTIGGTDGLRSFSATPRYDLQLPGVKIIYEQTHQLDEVTWTDHTVDLAGTETFGTAVLTVELSGASETTQAQVVGVTGINAKDINWWIGKDPHLAAATGPDGTGKPVIDADSAEVIPRQGAGEPNKHLGSELTSGETPDWLPGHSWAAEVKAKISYALTDDNGSKIVKINQPFSVHVTGTDLASRIYERVTSDTPAEEIPTGLAAAILASVSGLHYDGQLVFEHVEVPGQFKVGMRLNVSGGRAEWATMEAVVQGVTEQLATGQTTVTIGPPLHLGPQDFVELMRMNRVRRPTKKFSMRFDGRASVGSKVDGSVRGPQENTIRPEIGTREIVLADKKDTNASTIKISTDDILAAVRSLSDKDIKLRPLKVCDDSTDPPTARTILVLGSAAY